VLRIFGYWFHGFNAIITFAAAVIRSPKSSLAAAIAVHIEEGVELFERIPAGNTPYYDLVSHSSYPNRLMLTMLAYSTKTARR
jgi:hypothetical protein